MERKLFGVFSGTHLTIMACAAIIAPTALYATVSYSNVAIVNPNTGIVAAVDKNQRLYVLNPLSLYRDDPSYQVDIDVSNLGNSCETTYQYTVPAGQAFIITAMSGYEQQFSTTYSYAGAFVYDGAGCGGTLLTSHFSSVSSASPSAPVAVDFGVGIPVPAGSTISVYSDNDFGYKHIHGFLLPASYITAGQLQAKSTAADVAAKQAKVLH